jgi:hypothetical protein
VLKVLVDAPAIVFVRLAVEIVRHDAEEFNASQIVCRQPLPRIATSCLLEETVQACPDGTASFMHHGALLVGAEVQRPPYLTRRPSLDIAQDDDLS